MRFSIITVCKNNIDGMIRTIESIDDQKYLNYEHLIIDGDSSDGTREYVENHLIENRKMISEPDSGISDAFNKGLAIAQGDYILFLNSGDTFFNNDVLQDVSNDIDANEDIAILTYIGILGNHTVPERTEMEYAEDYWSAGKLPHQGTFVKRKVFLTVGNFDETLKLRMDYDFFYRCAKARIGHKYIPRVIVNYEDGGACQNNIEDFAIEGCIVQKRHEGHLCKQSVDELVQIYGYNNDDLRMWKMYKVMEEIAISGYSDNRFIDNIKRLCLKNVAIYGKGHLGKAVAEILVNNGIHVDYFIDRFLRDYGVYGYDDVWPKTDGIIIGVIDDTEKIKESLNCKTNVPVYELRDFV